MQTLVSEPWDFLAGEPGKLCEFPLQQYLCPGCLSDCCTVPPRPAVLAGFPDGPARLLCAQGWQGGMLHDREVCRWQWLW